MKSAVTDAKVSQVTRLVRYFNNSGRHCTVHPLSTPCHLPQLVVETCGDQAMTSVSREGTHRIPSLTPKGASWNRDATNSIPSRSSSCPSLVPSGSQSAPRQVCTKLLFADTRHRFSSYREMAATQVSSPLAHADSEEEWAIDLWTLIFNREVSFKKDILRKKKVVIPSSIVSSCSYLKPQCQQVNLSI